MTDHFTRTCYLSVKYLEYYKMGAVGNHSLNEVTLIST